LTLIKVKTYRPHPFRGIVVDFKAKNQPLFDLFCNAPKSPVLGPKPAAARPKIRQLITASSGPVPGPGGGVVGQLLPGAKYLTSTNGL